MKKNALFLLLALVSITLQAQIPAGYYNNAEGKTGEQLKTALYNIIHNHTNIGYSAVWSAFYSTDHRQDNVSQVWDMYSDIPGGTPPYVYDLGSDQCGSYNGEGNCYNREHSWPQSWFGDQGVPKCDMHHIYPTDGKVNAQRSNFPYGEVKKATWTSQNGSKLGTPKDALNYTGPTVFEPIDAYKGDIARGLFYMSVCYCNDDSNWGTSGMTNKSEILPWAMTMLLRWSDNDPVSQKEIDRNNAVHEVQGNRNPFIDHPEYAHMIWDENWSGGNNYAITCTTTSNGSVSAPANAMEGSTVAITATPNAGYMVGTYSVYKTGSPSTTVTVSSNGTFTMPGYDVTVSVTFVRNNTNYNIALGTVNHGTISASATTATSGTTITLNATPETGYSLYAWYVFKTGDMNTTVSVNGNSFIMPAFNVTVMASFSQGNTNGDYVKVTTAPSDWSGEYLIVCENYNVAFNGTVEAGWGRCSGVTITNATIASNTITDAYKVTVSKEGTGYKFRFPDNKYMSWTGAKTFAENTSAVAYSISLNNGNALISYESNILYYNYNQGSGGLRSYSTTGQTSIQLYKKSPNATAPTHTIYFNGNGNTGGSMSNQTVNEHEPTALNDNTFEKTGFVFDSWNTAADGSGDYYADGATVTLLDDITLYAQWDKLYSITLASVTNGSINASPMQAVEETTVSLSATPATNYELDHWTVTDANDNAITVANNQFVMPASNVTVSASFVYIGQSYTQKYYLVTDADQLVAGRTYLIVNTEEKKAMGTQNTDNNRSAVAATITNGILDNLGSAREFTLGASGNYWTFYDSHAGGYLYASSNSSNQLGTETTLDNNGKWSIVIGSGGAATITAQGSNSYKHMRYNKTKTWFTCFNSQSSGKSVYLLLRSEACDFTENGTVACLNTFDQNTIQSGVAITATKVLGKGMCNNATQLVINDGAQLMHYETDIEATFKKSVEAYSSDGGWYTIASPFTNCTPSQIATNTFDLYAYDEDSDLEWINYSAHQNTFTIDPSYGYLYAHTPSTTLRMTGTLNPGNYIEEVYLGYDNDDTNLKGYNLLGNPTAHDITFTKTSNVSDGYYYLENDEQWNYTTGNSVPTGRGFLVKANATGQKVTLNPTTKHGDDAKTQNHAFLQIDVDGEKAYVKMTDGVNMPLINFRGRTSNVYLTHNDKPYIMLVRGEAQCIDLNYQPKRTGQHQLKISLENAQLNYLHLVDHLTGANIDLLTTPSYSFESKTSDYATRFQLVFSPDAIKVQKTAIPN